MPEVNARTTWRRWGLRVFLLVAFVEWLARFSEASGPVQLLTSVVVFLASFPLFLRTTDWLLR